MIGLYNYILQKPYNSLKVFFYLFIVLASNLLFCREIDIKLHWNAQNALENPHKGWYHHYPDNHINKYIIRYDSHLLDFPGIIFDWHGPIWSRKKADIIGILLTASLTNGLKKD